MAEPPKAAAQPVMAVQPWESELASSIRSRLGDQLIESSTYLGQNFVTVAPESVVSLIESLKLEEDFDYLVDVTAVDYLGRPERFELVYILYSFARNERLRIKSRIPEGFRPQSLTGVHLGANWLEREVYDMFGIEFDGHPNLKRILLPDEWQGFPLRKDYGITQMDNQWVRENLGIESGQ